MLDDLPAIQVRQTMRIWADNACVAAPRRTCAHKYWECSSAVPHSCIYANHEPLERGENCGCNQARREQVSAPLLTPMARSAGWACNIHSALQSGPIALMMLMVPIGPCEQDHPNSASGMVLSGNRFFLHWNIVTLAVSVFIYFCCS